MLYQAETKSRQASAIGRLPTFGQGITAVPFPALALVRRGPEEKFRFV